MNQQEARAAALGELDTDTMDHRFQLMEQESEVDKQLAALKEKKGLAAPAAEPSKALGSGEAPAAKSPSRRSGRAASEALEVGQRLADEGRGVGHEGRRSCRCRLGR